MLLEPILDPTSETVPDPLFFPDFSI